VTGARPNKKVLALLGGVTVVAAQLNAFKRFERPVRCRDGHLFTTIWVPLGSLKALRLGPRRFQRCPVGHHWSMIRRLDLTKATPAELDTAAATHDLRIP
jgi:hypothetical protein